jgi:hypothetical protein
LAFESQYTYLQNQGKHHHQERWRHKRWCRRVYCQQFKSHATIEAVIHNFVTAGLFLARTVACHVESLKTTEASKSFFEFKPFRFRWRRHRIQHGCSKVHGPDNPVPTECSSQLQVEACYNCCGSIDIKCRLETVLFYIGESNEYCRTKQASHQSLVCAWRNQWQGMAKLKIPPPWLENDETSCWHGWEQSSCEDLPGWSQIHLLDSVMY